MLSYSTARLSEIGLQPRAHWRMFVVPSRGGAIRAGSSHLPAMQSPAIAFRIAVAALAVAAGAHAQVIDTTAGWNGSDYIAPFGQGIEADGGDTPTYGQTFRAPAINPLLTSFTFWVDSVGGSGATRFTGFIMEFDGARATGAPLFAGAEVSMAISPPTFPYVPTFDAVTFSVPSLALDPSRTYMAFISALPFFDDQDDTANVGYLFADVYNGGGFWFSNERTWNDLLSKDWENFIGGGTRDLAFRATFGAIPEPSSFALIGTGLLFALILFRRRG